MRCSVSVVKIGGGAITHKHAPESVDIDGLRAVARDIALVLPSKVALVHGGGSFGHFAVQSILSAKGALEARDASVVQRSMIKLANIVIDELIAAGVPASLHPPHAICHNSDINSCDTSLIARDLSLGLVPVTYGDAIPEGNHTKILSGDDLAAKISIDLMADCLIFAIRAPGVMDERGRVIKELTSLDEVKVIESPGIDVTGGIVKKVKAAFYASKVVRNVRIVNVRELLLALKGEEVGTKIVR